MNIKNLFKKNNKRTAYSIVLDKLKNNYDESISYKFKSKKYTIILTKNHIEYYYNRDPEKNIFKFFINDMYEPYFKEYALIKVNKKLILHFRKDKLDIDIENFNTELFLKRLSEIKKDFTKRLVEETIKLEKNKN